ARMPEDLDVRDIGAGISGINAGYRLAQRCPKKTFAILEGRDALGGTWDLFRYPGIRSDSDMFTLGFPFRPWRSDQVIADGKDILAYLNETARVTGVAEKIRFGHRVLRASWSSDAAKWTVEATKKDGTHVVFTCRFLFMCTGYYDYAAGYTPEWPGVETFRGRIVHPQKWTEDVAWEGKRVVVIGSGATAVGLVPALAEKAAHVTMLQRSPSYVMSFPGVDPMSKKLGPHVMRVRNTALGKAVYIFCRKFPGKAKELLVESVKKRVGDGYDVGTHFTPSYMPWDQRLCLVRDGDLFKRIREGKVDVVTDHIESFSENGIRTKSGREIEADLVVTATGLNVRLLGGVPLEIDGERVEMTKKTMYKAALLSDVPNLALSLGYVNASWTLRADLICEYVCRLLNAMDKKGVRVVTARLDDSVTITDEPVMSLTSGYMQRARASLPKQGVKRPWRNVQGYLGDLLALRWARVDDGVLHFEGRS
ncbi:MAG TPA: NAD(P)/FAD-dependent oxidoreductase, partial [Labilithrix sp.]